MTIAQCRVLALLIEALDLERACQRVPMRFAKSGRTANPFIHGSFSRVSQQLQLASKPTL